MRLLEGGARRLVRLVGLADERFEARAGLFGEGEGVMCGGGRGARFFGGGKGLAACALQVEDDGRVALDEGVGGNLRLREGGKIALDGLQERLHVRVALGQGFEKGFGAADEVFGAGAGGVAAIGGGAGGLLDAVLGGGQGFVDPAVVVGGLLCAGEEVGEPVGVGADGLGQAAIVGGAVGGLSELGAERAGSLFDARQREGGFLDESILTPAGFGEHAVCIFAGVGELLVDLLRGVLDHAAGAGARFAERALGGLVDGGTDLVGAALPLGEAAIEFGRLGLRAEVGLAA